MFLSLELSKYIQGKIDHIGIELSCIKAWNVQQHA